MPWHLIVSYRMRFDTSTNLGDILINHADSASPGITTTTLAALSPERFAAIAALLKTDKDHRILFDGTTIDAGPEQP